MSTSPDFSEQYNNLLKTPFGQDLLKSLKALHDSLIEDAEKAPTMEEGYALLNRAAGVILAVGHLQSKSVLLRDKGNK